jgi:hypothetical protein
MTLDVETPDLPTLSGAQDPGDYDAIDESEDAGDDYRREALAEFLDEGVWADAFHDWADRTSLTEAEFLAVLDADLVDEFDFYWTPRQRTWATARRRSRRTCRPLPASTGTTSAGSRWNWTTSAAP